jgi:hypothetical protein
MPRKANRSYKKGGPHRDFRKFVIVAEGQREDEYFAFFNKINQRIQIILVPRDKGKSATKYFTERADQYIDQYGIEPEDLLWFILDVDRWKRSEIDDLFQCCNNKKNWNIGISNPCFEVWLYFHFGNPSDTKAKNCSELKLALSKLTHGGYKLETFANEIETATKMARVADKNARHYFPELLNTKLYQLGEQMIKFMGNKNNWK